MNIITRSEAKKLSLKTYISGTTCAQGHENAVRLTINGSCLTCKQIRQSSPEYKEVKHIHYENNKDEILGKNKVYRVENRDKINTKHKEGYYANRDYYLEYNKLRRIAFPEKFKVWGKNWRVNNVGRVNAYRRWHQLSKIQRTPLWANKEKIAWFYEEAKRLTIETGVEHHVDHMVPLHGKLVSGLHVESNLRIITASENHKKNNKLDEELLDKLNKELMERLNAKPS